MPKIYVRQRINISLTTVCWSRLPNRSPIFAKLPIPNGLIAGAGECTLKGLKLTKASIGIPGLYEVERILFPFGIYQALREELPGADFKNASSLIENLRAIKSPEEITLVVQVNGKVRDRIVVPVFITEAEATQQALASPKVQAHLDGKEVAQVVFVPKRLLNLVLG